jgi:hypothetical protein
MGTRFLLLVPKVTLVSFGGNIFEYCRLEDRALEFAKYHKF